MYVCMYVINNTQQRNMIEIERIYLIKFKDYIIIIIILIYTIIFSILFCFPVLVSGYAV
jgi:hypothetical protein